jgi:cyanophycinase
MFKRIALAALVATLPCISYANPPASPKGTLVIVGGGGLPNDILKAFYEASGSKGGRIGIIPTATESPERALEAWRDDLEAAGIALVPLDIRSREDSETKAMLDAAKTCTGFWFSGGDQNYIGDKIVGTQMQKLLMEKYMAGACIGGTSAGAAIMSRIMITGEDLNGKESLAEMGAGAYRTREGMGFLPDHCVVDQHFLKRNRQNRLFSLMMEHPGKLGLGIDEATALIVKGGVAVVYGTSSVMIFDPSGMEQDKSGGFENLKINLLTKGQSIDLNTRKVKR